MSEEGALSSALRQMLNQHGWKFDQVTDTEFRFLTRTEDVEVRTQVLLYAEARMVRIYQFLTDDGYPANRELFVRELVERLSAEIVLGAFTYLPDGNVRFHYGYDVSSRDVTAEMFARVIGCTALPLSLWKHSFAMVTKKHPSAEIAVEWAMLQEEIASDEGVSRNTLKAGMTVQDYFDALVAETADAHPPALALVK